MQPLYKLYLLCVLLLTCSTLIAQCPSTLDQTYGTFNGGGPDPDHRQTFVPSIPGELVQLSVTANGGVTGTYTLSIYEGDGILGTLLYSGSHSYSVTGAQPVLDFLIPCGQEPILSVGTTYTFRIQGGLNVVFQGGSGAYANGYYWKSGGAPGNSDMNFDTWMSPPNKPDVTISQVNPISCFGDSDGSLMANVSGGVSPYTYSWLPSGNTQIISGLSAGTYYAQVVDLAGCYSCADTFVLADPPQVTVNASADQTICEGDSYNIPATSSGAINYSWSPGTGLSSTTVLNPIASPTTTTTYTITAQNGNGCVASDNMTISVNAAPTVNAGLDQTVCQGSMITLTGSGTATVYNWDNSVIDGSGFTPPIGATTYTVTGTDGNGCLNTDQVVVTVNPNPLPTLTSSDGDDIICAGDLVTFTASNASDYEFLINGLNVQGPSPSNVYNTSTLANGDVVSVIGTSGGCSTTAPQTHTMTVNSLPLVSFSALSPMCQNDAPYTLVEGSPIGGVYSGAGVSAGDFDPSATTTGFHTLTYTYTDGNGCSNMANQNINVEAVPTITATGAVAMCEGDTTSISANGGFSYSWDNSLGAGQTHVVYPTTTTTYTVTGTGGNGCQNTDNVTITIMALPAVTFGALSPLCMDGPPYTFTEGSPGGGTYSGPGVSGGAITQALAGLGTHTIYYSYTDGNGCVNQDSSDIEIYNSPTVTANATAVSICDGDALTLTGAGAVSYNWNNSVTDGVSFIPAVGTYNYIVDGFDSNGCSGSDTILVDVHSLPLIDGGVDQDICEGTATTLNGSGGLSYTWDNGVSNGVAFTPTVGTTTYTVVGTDANNCQNTDFVDITVNPNPTLTVSADQIFCLGDDVLLTSSGADSYSWDSGASTTPTYQITPTQSQNVQLIGYSSFGCVATHDVYLTLDDPTAIDAGPDQLICQGFTANLSASGGLDYWWNGPGFINENNQDISFSVDTTAYYIVTATTSNGCTYSDSTLITISTDPSCTISAVSGFSPNEDGVNDFWKIQGIEGFPENTVTIYNRWGDIVFEESAYDNDLIRWDGMYNGSKLGAGTYFYLIEIEGGPTQSGWIQLMK